MSPTELKKNKQEQMLSGPDLPWDNNIGNINTIILQLPRPSPIGGPPAQGKQH